MDEFTLDEFCPIAIVGRFSPHNGLMESFSVSTCPVCENWTLEDHFDTDPAEIEGFVKEHIYECFGVAEIFSDLPWPA